MKTQLNFKFQFMHHSTSGSAVVVNDINLVRKKSEEVFSEEVFINKIGSLEENQEGKIYKYDIYEAYQDSGSDDQLYFAINTMIE